MPRNKSYEINMCNGPLLGKMLLFSLPLMLSGILQLLFNAADMAIAGRLAGSQALAAVGSTSALIALLISLFVGFSVGTNVTISYYYGANQKQHLHETLHTSILLCAIGGIGMAIIGILLARPLLLLMAAPPNVIDQAVIYMQIYFAGIPVILVYNQGSAILRAIGDTRRPLKYLSIAGVVNVMLNLFFMGILHMGVAGVALATILSQCISSYLVLRALTTNDSICRLYINQLKIYPDKLLRILKIGIPAGLQSSLFSLSNALIQSSVNSFGAVAMAGSAASGNIEGFVFTSLDAFQQTSVSFTSQNMGANKYNRILKSLLICMVSVLIVGTSMGLFGLLFGRELLHFYTHESAVIDFGILRMARIMPYYALAGLMNVTAGSLRGMGHAILPTFVTLMGVGVLRIVWIYTIFSANRNLRMLFTSYPVTWGVTFLVQAIVFIYYYRRLTKNK